MCTHKMWDPEHASKPRKRKPHSPMHSTMGGHVTTHKMMETPVYTQHAIPPWGPENTYPLASSHSGNFLSPPEAGPKGAGWLSVWMQPHVLHNGSCQCGCGHTSSPLDLSGWEWPHILQKSPPQILRKLGSCPSCTSPPLRAGAGGGGVLRSLQAGEASVGQGQLILQWKHLLSPMFQLKPFHSGNSSSMEPSIPQLLQNYLRNSELETKWNDNSPCTKQWQQT